MRLSKRTRYALRALIDLGIAQAAGKPVQKIAALARYERLPMKFLEAILVQLNDTGFVASKRGKLGGVFLNRSLEQIRIIDVVHSIEPSFSSMPCDHATPSESCTCPDVERCALRALMIAIRTTTFDFLGRYTLADLAEQTLKRSPDENFKLLLELESIGQRSRGANQ